MTAAEALCRVCLEPTRDRAMLCDSCLRHLQRDISELPSLMHEVSNLATGQTRVYRANGRAADNTLELAEAENVAAAKIPAMLRSRQGPVKLPETRLMVNLPARELLYDAWDTLLGNACHLGADEMSSKNVVAWLLSNLRLIRFSDDAGSVFDELTYLHRQLEAAVDRSPSRLYAGPCHNKPEDGEKCQRALYAWPGADTVECDGYDPTHRTYDLGCRTKHTVESREEWLIATVHDALLPLATWQTALPRMFKELAWPNRSTWWRWIQNRRLTAVSIDRDAVELFRGGDVVDLVIQEQPRILGNRGKRGRMSA